MISVCFDSSGPGVVFVVIGEFVLFVVVVLCDDRFVCFYCSVCSVRWFDLIALLCWFS